MASIAYRIEYKNKGPFYEDKTLKRLITLSRKATPNWKQVVDSELESTFLQNYMYGCTQYTSKETLELYWILRKSESKSKKVLFGFNSIQSLVTEFGLDREIYLNQFKYLLDKVDDFKLLVLLVDEVLVTEREVLFFDYELIEEVTDSRYLMTERI